MKKLLFFITIAFLLLSCGAKAPEEKAVESSGNDSVVTLTTEQAKNAGIVTGKIQNRSISSILKLNGKIDVPPQNMTSVSAPLGGYLKSTRLLPGMHIAKGEILAVMEDIQYIQLQQDYLTTKAQFLYNEREYNRQKELNESKATSDKVFEQVKAAYQTQEALMRSLEQKLKLIGLNPDHVTPANISRTINIYSPINGFVSAVNVNIGKYVNPSDVLFELVNPSDIHLALTVFEKDLDKIYLGQKLVAYTNSQPGKKFPCTILLISKNVTHERSAEVHCHFEQYDKSLVPGMFMNAEIDVFTNDAKVLPDDAIVRYENRQFVFVAKTGNQFEMLEVKTGFSENGFTEVVVEEKYRGENFVVKGAYNLLMKTKNTRDE